MLCEDYEGMKNAIYFSIKKFLDYQNLCSTIEKICLDLVLATKKLRDYLLNLPIKEMAKMDPLKYLH